MLLIKNIFIELTKFTILYYIYKLFHKREVFQLNALSSFWKNLHVNKSQQKQEKIILVECLEKLNPNMDSYFKLVPMLSKIYKIKVIALVSYGSYQETVNFLSYYHNIDKVETVYRFLDFRTKLKAIYILFQNLPFTYSSTDGFSLIVENKNIGDLVYDEYLRISKSETLRKTNFLYYLMCYNAIYAHLRYEEIINKNSITDIIALRDTYSHSSFNRAGKVLEKLTIWKNRAGKLSSIRKLAVFPDFTYKPFYIKKKFIEYIKNEFSKDEIIKLYEQIVENKVKGSLETIESQEIKLAHCNNTINTQEEFYNFYKLENKFTIVIYSQVFVDAVRYPHKVIFSDKYTWLVETLKYFVKNKDYNILVKPHPSEKMYSLSKTVEIVVTEINEEFNSNILLIDKQTSAEVIYKIADIIITGTGTIALEAPCEGIKVITAGSSNFENTDAMFRSDSQKKYFGLLDNIETLPEITEEQKFNSKAAFIWHNVTQYVQSPISISLSKKLSMKERLEELNNMYLHAKNKDVDPLFERLLDDRIN